MTTITPIPAFRDNYIWALTQAQEHAACAVVDPGDANPVLSHLQANQLELSAILITHHHADHTGGIAQLKAHFPEAIVYGPASDPVSHLDRRLKESDRLRLPTFNLQFEILDIPGHTLGHIAFWGEGLLFCGDTLFTGGCGKIFEGTPAQMHASLNKLAELPPDTQIYCGHEYTQANLRFAAMVEPNNLPLQQRIKAVDTLRKDNLATVPTSLALELETNPFLRTDQPAVISAAKRYAEQGGLNPVGTSTDVLATLRLWKNAL